MNNRFGENVIFKKQPKSAKKSELSAKELTKLAVSIAIDQKALDVRALDIAEISDVADYFIIASGTSQRHVKGIADRIQVELKKSGEAPISTSGNDQGEWVLIDYANVVIHIFYEPMRQYYDLDGMWQNANSMQLPSDLTEQAKKLRTGIYKD